jgi:hypothetical protein
LDILEHFAAARPGRGEEPCSCCRSTGEHEDRSECDRCDGSGRMHRGDDAALPWCPGRENDQPAPPKRRHWRQAGVEDYGIHHRPMEHGAPLHDLTGEAHDADYDHTSYWGPDYLTHPQHFSDTSPPSRDDHEALAQMRRVQGKPDAEVDIYRASHHSAPHEINTGDWVTLSKSYAAKHAYAESGDDEPENQYTVHHAKVPARHVRDAGSGGYREQGYWGPPIRCCGKTAAAGHGHMSVEDLLDLHSDEALFHERNWTGNRYAGHSDATRVRTMYDSKAEEMDQNPEEWHQLDEPIRAGTIDPVLLAKASSGHTVVSEGAHRIVRAHQLRVSHLPVSWDPGSQAHRGDWDDPEPMQHQAVLPMPSYGPEPKYDFAPEDWPPEKRDAHNEAMFETRRRWKAHIKRGLSLGHLSAEQAKGHGYYFGGHETDDQGAPKWARMPHEMYHVTTDEPGVREHGLKTRAELDQQRGGHGLGGGEDDTISLTTDKHLAHGILGALHEFHGAVNGTFTPRQMWDQAKAGHGASRPWHTDIARYWDKDWKDGDPHPDGLRRALEGTKRWYTGGSSQEMMDKVNGPGTRPSKDDEGWMSGHKPPQKMHAYWEKDMDPDERRENAADFYKHFAVHRQIAGGPEDPMFFATDTKAFAAKDPKHFAMLHVRPKPGAQGYPVSSMSEWRTGTGDALDVHHTEHLEPHQQHEGSAGNFGPYSHFKFRTSAWEKTSGPVPAAERTESVAHMLAHYKPYDFDTWAEARDNIVWDHPSVRAFVADVARNGVKRPIPVDYEQDPPQVRNGHTRLLAAERAGITHVPTRQHEGFMDPDDPDHLGRGPDDPGHWTNQDHWNEREGARQAGWSYDTNIKGRVTAHGPAGQHEDLWTAGTGLTHLRHPQDVPAPLYHGSRKEFGPGEHIEPGHPGNFVSRMTHVYATEQAEPDDAYKGARGYGQHVYEVKPTGWYGHRRDARGIEWASSDPWEVVRKVPRPGQHEAVLPMPGMRNPHTGGDEWFHGTRAYPEELSQHGFQDPMTTDESYFEHPDSEPNGSWNGLLGTHFTADHDIAKDFALGEHTSGRNERHGDEHRGESRGIIHARLGMHNPKVYDSEHDMDHEAYEHEYAAGNHPSNHIPLGSDDEDDRAEVEEMWPEAHRIHQQFGNHKIWKDKIEGSFGYGANPHPARTTWLNRHPDRWGIADRFRRRLQDQGHDGVIYGNEYEVSKHGTEANKSAIVFDPHRIQVTQHHGAYEDHLSPGEAEHQQARMPGHGQEPLPLGRAGARRKPLQPDQEECWKCGVRDSKEKFTKASPYAPVMGLAMECTDKDACRERRESRHTAVFVPTERIFGPTYGLDHRLFTKDEQLKPEVRQALLGRLQGVLEPVLGPAWDVVTRVYLAGSQASKWTSPELVGNGDLDVLIGVAYSYARRESMQLADLTDTEIDRHLNTILQQRFNAPGWHPPFDPDGTYDLTGYVNHNALDIRVIKPYAAYDLTRDDWAVKPPDMPDWSPEQFPQGSAVFQEARGLISQVRAILRLPEPFRTQEAGRIWDYIHGGRVQDFSETGLGWQGTANVLEKALDQASGDLVSKLKQLKYGPADHAPVALGHGMTTADLEPAHA